MISDKIESYILRIIQSTKDGKLNWRPIEDYISVYDDNESLSSYISIAKSFEFSELNLNKSFFVKKGESYLALLQIKRESGYDGSISEAIELIGVKNKKDDVFQIPAYIDGGFRVLQNEIIKYWNSNNDYALEMSELFDFLDKFSLSEIPYENEIVKRVTENDIRARIISLPSEIIKKLPVNLSEIRTIINEKDEYFLSINWKRRFLSGVTNIFKKYGFVSYSGESISKEIIWKYNQKDNCILLTIN